MNNPFQSPAFSMTALTAAINILPNQFGKLDQLNLMPARPVRFRRSPARDVFRCFHQQQPA